MDKKKIVYIISDINKSVAFQWLFKELCKEFDLKVILLNPNVTALQHYCLENNIECNSIKCHGKKDWPIILLKIYKLLKKWKPCVVHCHLLQATILGLSAAKLAHVKVRIYTRHHSSEHHIYQKKGVIWDKLSNQIATKIISISSSVSDILMNWEKVPQNKVVLIPHGFRIETFEEVTAERKIIIKKKYNLNNSNPVIGVISRFVDWKGVQYIIPAFKKIVNEYPNAALVLLNTKGNYAGAIYKQLAEIHEDNKRLIAFEDDMPAMYHCMDAFVHVPINAHCEAFGQIYVEALAARVPSVFTLSGIAPQFVEHGFNALVVNFKAEDEIYNAIKNILEKEEIRIKLQKNSSASIQYFSFERFVNDLLCLYKSSVC